MKVYSIIIFFYLFITFSFAQEQNYTHYHKEINKAEELFFVQQKTDSALYYYDKVFKTYDFIFLKDLINAAQIAVYTKKPYKKYIEKGFEQGLKISHLQNYPLFNDYYKKNKDSKTLQKVYKEARKNYLKKIDFEYLDLIYKLAIKDQLNKHKSKNQSKYRDQVYNITERIKDSVIKRGFPGDRVIGISDSTIFKEIGKPHLDLYDQRKKYKKLSYMVSGEKYLNAKHPIVIFIHNPCSYFLYKDMFIEEIKKGNMHPREVAILHDNIYGYYGNIPSCKGMKKNAAYFVHPFISYSKKMDKVVAEKMREELFIVPMIVDAKKKLYEKEHGFKLFSGFWGCR
ncbi:hypothetical protein [Aquimarina rhabdastrellae]